MQAIAFGTTSFWKKWVLSFRLTFAFVQLIDVFVMLQAIIITRKQQPKNGQFPDGAYYNSRHLNEAFFTEDSREQQSQNIRESMPFLYKLITSKLQKNEDNPDSDEEDSSNNSSSDISKNDNPPRLPEE